ncbi:MAG: ABC transporter substrate-binding protein [Candidatus Thorarchaeota archaeon]
MTNEFRKKTIALSLVAVFLFMIMSPILVSAQTDTVPLKNGAYVDKLVYSVITQDDQQVLALQDDEIDLIGGMVDPSFLDTLIEAEDIDVADVLRNGYGYVVINTAKYPYNITDFRRALAFALDKEAISDDVWDGLSQPLDSCVPDVNPYSIEGQLPYTYYEANVALGNDMLDAAGFDDIDDDGYREAPDGSEFDVLVECAQSSPIAIEVGQKVAEALTALSVEAVSVPTDFYEYLNRLYFHGDFDMVFLGSSFTNFDVDWLAYEFWSEYADEPYWNFANFRNATYDSWRDQLLHATDYEDVYEAAIEMQRIWVHASPMIICYENVLLSAYRTDRFEGFINDVSDGVPGWWTNYKVHLKDALGGPFGGTFRWANPLDLDTFNFMVSSSAYTMNVLGELYDSLIIQDPDGNDVMWLAETYEAETHDDNPAVPEGYTRFTFDIIQNATWTDGALITGEDIAFSLNYFRDAPGNPYGADLSEMTAAYAPTTYTVVVEFGSESFWHLHTVGYKPIIPKHFFQEIGLDGWNLWNPDPPNEAMITSGPYNVSDYVAGEFVELTRYDNYFYALSGSSTGPSGPTTEPDPVFLAIVAGAVGASVVILVGGYVLMRQR